MSKVKIHAELLEIDLLRKNSRRHEIVQGSLLKLSDDSTIISTLMRVTCLAQSHLMLNDSLNNEEKPQKFSFRDENEEGRA